MFPLNSPGTIVPVVAQPVAGLFAADPVRQATIGELMPYFLGYGKVELRWAAGTLEKYEDAMGWVIRWLGDIAPGRITQQHILVALQCHSSSNEQLDCAATTRSLSLPVYVQVSHL